MAQDSDILIAMFDYDGRIRETLTFEKGEQFRFLDTDSRNGDWWLVRRIDPQERGLIPANYVARIGSNEAHEWFYQGVTRDETEAKLSERNLKLGTFLLREQRTGMRLVLSVRQSKRRRRNVNIQHYVINTIKKNDMTFYFIFDENRACSSLQQLLEERQRSKGDLPLKLGNFLPQAAPDLPVAPVDDIDLSEYITETTEIGCFSNVTKGKLKIAGADPREVVLKECHDIKRVKELVILRHANVIHIHGYYDCHYTSKTFVVMEFIATTLEAAIPEIARAGEPVNTFLKMACQVAGGMHYLAICNTLHGRLAARNIFLTSDGVLKISDFGILNGECYKEEPHNNFVRWTAVEMFPNGTYTIKSDVWSFGMVLYEMMSMGQHPYNDLTAPSAVIRAIRMNVLPLKTEQCPPAIYEVMLRCWRRIPEERPHFQELEDTFRAYTSGIGYSAKLVLPRIPSYGHLYRRSQGADSGGSEKADDSRKTGHSTLKEIDHTDVTVTTENNTAACYLRADDKDTTDGTITNCFNNGTSICSAATFPVTVTAKYSFDARDQDELSFSYDEDMEVVSVPYPGWLLAEHMTTMKRGLIPSNYVDRKDFSADMSEYEDICPVLRSSGASATDDNSAGSPKENTEQSPKPGDESLPKAVDVGKFPIAKINNASLERWFKAVENLNHENLLSKYNMFIEQDICQFMMDVSTSATGLHTLLTTSQYQPLQHCEVAIQIAQGMEYLGDASIIHGDLQASCVWVYPGDVIKIGKVGIMSTLNSAVGEWPRSPPEVMTIRRLVRESDVWSYGALLAEMFSQGVVPDSRDFLLDTSDEPVFQQQDHWPDKIYDIMKKCMQNTPDDRPLFSDIIVELNSFRQKLLIPALPSMPVTIEEEVADLREQVRNLEQRVREHDRMLMKLSKTENGV